MKITRKTNPRIDIIEKMEMDVLYVSNNNKDFFYLKTDSHGMAMCFTKLCKLPSIVDMLPEQGVDKVTEETTITFIC